MAWAARVAALATVAAVAGLEAVAARAALATVAPAGALAQAMRAGPTEPRSVAAMAVSTFPVTVVRQTCFRMHGRMRLWQMTRRLCLM